MTTTNGKGGKATSSAGANRAGAGRLISKLRVGDWPVDACPMAEALTLTLRPHAFVNELAVAADGAQQVREDLVAGKLLRFTGEPFVFVDEHYEPLVWVKVPVAEMFVRLHVPVSATTQEIEGLARHLCGAIRRLLSSHDPVLAHRVAAAHRPSDPWQPPHHVQAAAVNLAVPLCAVLAMAAQPKLLR